MANGPHGVGIFYELLSIAFVACFYAGLVIMFKMKKKILSMVLLPGMLFFVLNTPTAAQTLQLSRNADFSTSDGLFAFSDILHARVSAPNLNYFDIDNNEFRLQPAGGGDEIKGAFTNNFDGSYETHLALQSFNRSYASWEFRVEIRDRSDGEFIAGIMVTIQDTPGIGDTLEVEARIDSVGQAFLFLAGKTVFVDSSTVIRERGRPLPFSALQKNWKVGVEAERRLDNNWWALIVRVQERSTTYDIETEGIIASIQGAVVTVNNIKFIVQYTTEILDRNDNRIPLDSLRVGMPVEAKGRHNPNDEVIAVRIKIQRDGSGGNEIELTGTITAIFNADSAAADSLRKFIWVNNTPFEVDTNTQILGFNWEPISFFDLHVGEVVEIEARIRLGQAPLATRIKREDQNGEDMELTAVIQALGDSTLTLAELQFRVTRATIILDYDNRFISLAALRTGLLVEVRANVLSDSSLVATRIQIEEDNLTQIEVKGFIDALTNTSLTVSGLTFVIGDSVAVIDQNGSATHFAALRAGMLVEVRGLVRFDRRLQATFIKIEDFIQDEIVIRGVISAIGADSLRVTGITFYIDAFTEIIARTGQLIDVSQLAVGMVVEIRARFQNGTWSASRIAVEDRIDAVVEIFSKIASLDQSGFSILQRRFRVTNTTFFLKQDDQPIPYSVLRADDFVEVRAQLLPDSSLAALRVKLRDNANDEVQFTGSVSALSSASITVSGFVGVVNNATVFLNHDGQSITINDLRLGMVVEVTAQQLNDGAVLALRVEVEDRRALIGVLTQVSGNVISVQGLPHVLTGNSVILDQQNRRTTVQALQVNHHVRLVAQRNQLQQEVLTLRIISGTTSVEDGKRRETPKSFTLFQNYPNPFNPSTVIRFVLPQAGQTRLTVYNILGHRIRTLVDGVRSAGEHQVTWDARSDAGTKVASGIYFYRLEAHGLTQARKLTLQR
jgi:flagellar hook assembly protein FlgD